MTSEFRPPPAVVNFQRYPRPFEIEAGRMELSLSDFDLAETIGTP